MDLNISEYEKQRELLYSEKFWQTFIRKAVEPQKIENRLWDFKKTFEMWHVPSENKEQEQIKFCEKVTSFANADGGVLIVGISDETQREIIGFDDMKDLENKVEDCHNIILRWTRPKKKFFDIQQVVINDDEGKPKSCFIVAVAQTKDAMGVMQKNGAIIYKVRGQTGSTSADPDKIKKQKENVRQKNYNFLYKLKEYCKF